MLIGESGTIGLRRRLREQRSCCLIPLTDSLNQFLEKHLLRTFQLWHMHSNLQQRCSGTDHPKSTGTNCITWILRNPDSIYFKDIYLERITKVYDENNTLTHPFNQSCFYAVTFRYTLTLKPTSALSSLSLLPALVVRDENGLEHALYTCT